MKRWLTGAVLVLLLTVSCASAESARSALLMDMKSGRILYEQNAHEPLPQASLTKVMTALIALENCALDEPVTTGKNAFGVPGTSLYLQQGEVRTMEEMLYGLLLVSGNDAAVAIAEHVAGSVEDFCVMMTKRAEELGCENTVFMTPHGLPNSVHHTTAYDMVLIAREAMKNEVFRKIVGTTRYEMPWEGHDYNRVLRNKNKLLTTYPGATGIKTGYTNKAGRCLLFSAERGEMAVIGVVLNCPDWFTESARIMDEAYEKYEWVRILGAGERVAEVEIIDGAVSAIGVCPETELAVTVQKGVVPRLVLELPSALQAGIRRGDTVGTALIYEGDRAVHAVQLLAMEDAPEAQFRHLVKRVVQNWQFAAP